MISRLKLLNDLTTGAYTALIQGNGGEEELVISISPGQDGMTPLSVIAMSVDGGAKRLDIPSQRSRAGFPLIRTTALMETLQVSTITWACSGIEPSAAQRREIAEEIQIILNKLEMAWELGC